MILTYRLLIHFCDLIILPQRKRMMLNRRLMVKTSNGQQRRRMPLVVVIDFGRATDLMMEVYMKETGLLKRVLMFAIIVSVENLK